MVTPMQTLSKLDVLLVGMGVGLLVAALLIKLASVEWLVVSAGVLLMLVGGTRVLSRSQERAADG
jgi:hypothetical protein